MRRIVAAGLIAIMAGCGGGGGGGGGPSANDPTLTIDRSSITLDIEQGEAAPLQVIEGSLVNVTSSATVVIGYTNNAIGTAVFASTSATTGRVFVTPRDPAELAPGTYDDTLTVQACLDTLCTRQAAGSPRTVTMRYTVRRAAQAAAMVPAQRAVAFAVVPGGSRTTQAITIDEPTGSTAGWTASSSAAWLTVTPSGNNGSAMQLQASATGLPDGLHTADVTVRPATGSAATARVRVGLYKSSATAATRLAQPVVPPIGAITAPTVADPIRPLAYQFEGGSVVAQHFHTGQRVATLALPGTGLIRQLLVDDEGSTLYALDAQTSAVIRIDLDSFSVLNRIEPANWHRAGDSLTLGFARVAGRTLLVVNQGFDAAGNQLIVPVMDGTTGELVGRISGYGGWSYSFFTPGGPGVLYATDRGLIGSNSGVTRIQLRSNSRGTVFNSVSTGPGANTSSSTLNDFAVSPDGSRVLMAAYGSTLLQGLRWSGSVLAADAGLPGFGLLPVGEIEFLPDGRYLVFAGSQLNLYAPDGALRWQWTGSFGSDPLLDASRDTARVSADGLRLLGSDQLLALPQ